MSGGNGVRTLYLLTAVALLATTGGFVLATTLSATTISQSASLFSVSTGGLAAFPSTPTVAMVGVPSGVSSCTSGPVPLSSGGVAVLYEPASSGVVCTANDFAVVLNFTTSANAAAGSYTFTQYTSYGSGPTTGADTEVVSIASALTSAGTVSVYVDYGTAGPPSGGIASLSVSVG